MFGGAFGSPSTAPKPDPQQTSSLLSLFGGAAQQAALQDPRTQELQGLMSVGNSGFQREFGALQSSAASAQMEFVSGGEETKTSEQRAKMAPRRVTDFLCLAVLLACLAVLGWVTHYATKHGDLRRLHHGFDFLGHLCGVGDFETRPFLFYCASSSSSVQLDLQHPICVEKCPETSDLWHSCYAGAKTSVVQTDPMTGSFAETLSYEFAKVSDYETFVFLGRYCMPVEQIQYDEMKDVVLNQYGNGITEWVLEIMDSWEALIVAFVVAFAAGFAYLFCLEHLAGRAVYVCLIMPCLAFCATGIYLVAHSQGALASRQGLVDPTFESAATTGNGKHDLILGAVLAAVGVLFGIVAICCREAVETAVGCIEATCECLLDVPSLLLIPVITLCSQVLVLSIVGFGFLLLVSCGNVKEESMAHFVSQAPEDLNVRGILRTFEYRESEYYYLAFYIFMMFWLFEIVGALCQFMLIYTVEIWYFVPYKSGSKRDIPSGLLLRGAMLGLLCHMGSIAMGACLVATLRLFRMIGSVLAKQQEKQNNAVGSATAKCCVCVLTCFERFVKVINKNAYMDVAMHSNTFCTAASESFKWMMGEILSVSVLNGVTWVLQAAGIGTVSVAGAGGTYLLIKTVPMFSDPGQETFVPNPEAICIAAAVISALVAWSFMMVFDIVSDTILFCFVIDQHTHSTLFNWDSYAPPGLRKLMDKHSAPTVPKGLFK